MANNNIKYRCKKCGEIFTGGRLGEKTCPVCFEIDEIEILGVTDTPLDNIEPLEGKVPIDFIHDTEAEKVSKLLESFS